MISRIWHGWTTLANADKYETLLKEEIFVGIQNRHIRGFKGIQLLRRDLDYEVEFITIMTFDSLDAVRKFAFAIFLSSCTPGAQFILPPNLTLVPGTDIPQQVRTATPNMFTILTRGTHIAPILF